MSADLRRFRRANDKIKSATYQYNYLVKYMDCRSDSAYLVCWKLVVWSIERCAAVTSTAVSLNFVSNSTCLHSWQATKARQAKSSMRTDTGTPKPMPKNKLEYVQWPKWAHSSPIGGLSSLQGGGFRFWPLNSPVQVQCICEIELRGFTNRTGVRD